MILRDEKSDKRKEYYEDGTLKAEWSYRNGKPEGTARTYYKGGALKGEGNFEGGKL